MTIENNTLNIILNDVNAIENMDPLERECFFAEVRRDTVNNIDIANLRVMKPFVYLIEGYLDRAIYIDGKRIEVELEGLENIPKDCPVFYAANHSNSRDIFVGYKAMALINRLTGRKNKTSIMVATDCLDTKTAMIFRNSGSTMLDRNIKESRQHATLEAAKRSIEGEDVLFFVEGTWNLNPIRVNQENHIGINKSAYIANSGPIIPLIITYKEKKGIITKESDLYESIKISIGKPISINQMQSIKLSAEEVKKGMDLLRKEKLIECGQYYENIELVDPDKYMRNTILKMFHGVGFVYDQIKEASFLRGNKENVYVKNSMGFLAPGFLDDLTPNADGTFPPQGPTLQKK